MPHNKDGPGLQETCDRVLAAWSKNVRGNEDQKAESTRLIREIMSQTPGSPRWIEDKRNQRSILRKWHALLIVASDPEFYAATLPFLRNLLAGCPIVLGKCTLPPPASTATRPTRERMRLAFEILVDEARKDLGKEGSDPEAPAVFAKLLRRFS